MPRVFNNSQLKMERRFRDIPESAACRLSRLKAEFVQETESCYYGWRDEPRFP
jgi:hypothetical protein